jgi:hypothetical protein
MMVVGMVVLTLMVVGVNAKYLFVPDGFDSNDDVVAVIDGYLPDTCHKLMTPEVTKDAVTGKIQIQAKAKDFSGACFDVTVPFTTVINLGNLAEGKYTVDAGPVAGKENLNVKLATKPGQDDFLYAPVENARVAFTPDQAVAYLEGRLTSSCMSFDKVEVIPQGKTIVVLPILQVRNASASEGFCKPVDVPFERKVQLPELAEGRYLLHVRSLNGGSINTVFTKTKTRAQ